MTLRTLTLAAAVLTWLMIMAASLLRTRGEVSHMLRNRDQLPPASPLAARADRAAKNMLENLVLFVALVVAGGAQDPSRAVLGAEVFVIARALYWPIYTAGIPVVRTLVWGVSIIGLAVLGSASI